MSFLYIFGKEIRQYHLSITRKKKRLTGGVNGNNERLIEIGSVSLPYLVKISSDRKFTVTKDRVVGKKTRESASENERVRERESACAKKKYENAWEIGGENGTGKKMMVKIIFKYSYQKKKNV